MVREEPREGSSATAGGLADDSGPRVVFLGTSLTEGLGLSDPEAQAWPSQVRALAATAGISVQIVNAGVSGETSAGALRRVEWLLRDPPDLFVIETGANDGLRALPVSQLESNLDSLLARIQSVSPSTRVAVVQMEAPPNLGAEYTEEFRSVFPRVVERWGAILIPFPLDGIAGVATLNQADGTHPTAEGHRRMAEIAWPTLQPLFREF